MSAAEELAHTYNPITYEAGALKMKYYHEFPWYQRLLLSLIWVIEKKLYKREWTYCDQVYHAMIQVQDDSRWMAHDEKISATSERHLAMLKDNWYETSHPSSDTFRRLVGACPHQKRAMAQ